MAAVRKDYPRDDGFTQRVLDLDTHIGIAISIGVRFGENLIKTMI